MCATMAAIVRPRPVGGGKRQMAAHRYRPKDAREFYRATTSSRRSAERESPLAARWLFNEVS
jgi:hypothetical protein